MSERNGDRARFQKNRRRKLLHRQRVHALIARLRQQVSADPPAAAPIARAPAEPAGTGD